MAEPAKFALVAGTWVKVATAVQFGIVWPENREGASLWFTYRNTGNPPPVGTDGSEKPFTSDYAVISHSEDIDVYIMREDSGGECTVCV